MKPFIAILCGGLALAATAAARPAIILSGRGYYDDERVVLNVFADSAVQLRSFGIRLSYPSEQVSDPTVFTNPALWFLAAQAGQRSAYSPVQMIKNSVRIVGARFQGAVPGQGVQGQELLLASIVFQRIGSGLPSFVIDLAGPEFYASFVTVGGGNMDQSIEGLGTLELNMEKLSTDSDHDGIPDSVELGWFNNLTQATATSDSDGDGTPDIDEWVGGTDPQDRNSMTRLVLQMQPDGSRLLSWSGQSGRVYDILKSTDLSTFVPLAEGLTSDSAASLLDAVGSGRGFYRLRIHPPWVDH